MLREFYRNLQLRFRFFVFLSKASGPKYKAVIEGMPVWMYKCNASLIPH